MQGKIIKGIAGFYYVHVPGSGTYECRAKGIFRKKNIKPLVGDDVRIGQTQDSAPGCEGSGVIEEILPRRSALIRPAVANIDQALLIFAVAKPEPNLDLLDRFLVMMRQQGLGCILCFNKTDLAGARERQRLEKDYAGSGCRILFVSAEKKEGLADLALALHGRTTAVAGPSGVGKSSLINCLQDGRQMETGDISRKIERGRHTTRHSELIAVSDGTYIMDTPGFSSLSLSDIPKDALKSYYPEFAPYEGGCRFMTCAHIHEPACGVKEALGQGRISQARYDRYAAFYEELREKEKRKY